MGIFHPLPQTQTFLPQFSPSLPVQYLITVLIETLISFFLCGIMLSSSPTTAVCFHDLPPPFVSPPLLLLLSCRFFSQRSLQNLQCSLAVLRFRLFAPFSNHGLMELEGARKAIKSNPLIKAGIQTKVDQTDGGLMLILK